jgi:hypothetical protein
MKIMAIFKCSRVSVGFVIVEFGKKKKVKIREKRKVKEIKKRNVEEAHSSGKPSTTTNETRI